MFGHYIKVWTKPFGCVMSIPGILCMQVYLNYLYKFAGTTHQIRERRCTNYFRTICIAESVGKLPFFFPFFCVPMF